MHLLSAKKFDYENEKYLNIRVRTTDNYGKHFDKQFQIDVINILKLKKEIIFYQFDIPKNAKKGTIVGIFAG